MYMKSIAVFWSMMFWLWFKPHDELARHSHQPRATFHHPSSNVCLSRPVPLLFPPIHHPHTPTDITDRYNHKAKIEKQSANRSGSTFTLVPS